MKVEQESAVHLAELPLTGGFLEICEGGPVLLECFARTLQTDLSQEFLARLLNSWACPMRIFGTTARPMNRACRKT